MKITWADIGNPKVSGTYFCARHDVHVDVRSSEIETWIDNPNAQARLVRYGTLDGDDNYNIGRMEV